MKIINQNMKKILIIGAKGMLGQELVSIFKEDKDYKVIGWDREDIDIANEVEVNKKISVIRPEAIINAAAYNAVDKCEEDAKEYKIAEAVNGLAPGYIAKVAKKLGAVFVQYSSDYVFSGEPEIPEPEGCTHSCASCALHKGRVPEVGFKEDDIPNPVNKYGRTKLLGEEEIKKNARKYYLIRPSKIFGKPAISEGSKRSFFDVMLEFGKKGEVRKLVDEETSCFTYAPDLAKKTKEIIDSKKPFGIYHVTNSEPCTWYEGAVELYKLAGIKTELTPITGDQYPRPAKRPFCSVLINTKLNPMRSYKEALKEYLKSIK